MNDYVILYNPEDVQLEKFHEFFTPVSKWGDEIIAEIDVVKEEEIDEMEEWLRGWTFSTGIVARLFREIEEPEQHHLFEDLYPRSDVTDIIQEETPGGDIRKYTTDLYGGVDLSIKFDVGWSQNIRHTTAFEPISMDSVSELVDREIVETGRGSDQYYPTGSEVLSWADRVTDEFPQAYCGAIGSFHFTDGEAEAGCTGFVIYNASEEIMNWAREIWVEEEDTNMKYPPSEFDLRTEDEDYSPPNADLIRMWWD